MRSLERVLAILESVALAGTTSPTRVAADIGLAPSTVARLMRDMADQKLLERATPASYRLGERFLLLIESAGAQRDPLSRVRPVLERLRDLSDETATLHVLRGGLRVCIASAESPHPMRRVGQVGEALPLKGSATAQVLLAGLEPAEREQYMSEMELSDEDMREFLDSLADVAETRWSMASDRWIPHVTGISAAVARQGRTVAAITIAGPISRFSDKDAFALKDDLLEAAREVGNMRLPTWWS